MGAYNHGLSDGAGWTGLVDWDSDGLDWTGVDRIALDWYGLVWMDGWMDGWMDREYGMVGRRHGRTDGRIWEWGYLAPLSRWLAYYRPTCLLSLTYGE
jgi:hypothetical protein